jgi:monoamine oxidase
MGVTLVEARPRLGGRILTHSAPGCGPVELGAEFVQGQSPALWQRLQSISLFTDPMSTEHATVDRHGRLNPLDVAEAVAKVLEKIEPQSKDESVEHLLAKPMFSADERRIVRDYVEGFHAAPADQFGVQAFLAAETASKKIQGDKLARVRDGYGALVRWLEDQLPPLEANILLNAEAKRISWKPGQVAVEVSISGALQVVEAAAVVVTLPVAVWKIGTTRFDPPIPEKEEVIAGFGVGQVTKLVLRFKEQFWPKNFGFVHTFDERLPTWWTTDDPLTLVGWGGDPATRRNAELTSEGLVRHALELLAQTFGHTPARNRESVAQFYTHNWQRDPYARLAYSYLPVGQLSASSRLAAPIDGTLFFAGEATAPDFQFGTVHGALNSGQRVAQEVLASLGSADR